MAMSTILTVLALSAIVVNASPVDVNSERPPVDCNSVIANHKIFVKCRGKAMKNYYVDGMSLDAKKTCRNRDSIVKCMAKATKSCRNNLEIEKFTEASFGYCDKESVAPLMADFFENNAGKVVSSDCIGVMLSEIRNISGTPHMSWSTLTGVAAKIALTKSINQWFINHFSQMNQTETVAACNGMTRQTIYGIMLANLNIYIGWGFDFYPEFVNIVQPANDPWEV